VLKKLQKEARAMNPDDLPNLRVSEYFAGRSIFSHYRK
jgi:hypothetical protein